MNDLLIFQKGQVWRSSKTWWRIEYAESRGSLIIFGPRGMGGTDKSPAMAGMTRDGFRAWIFASGAWLMHPIDSSLKGFD